MLSPNVIEQFRDSISVLDIEVGPNYFIFGLHNVKTNQQLKFGVYDNTLNIKSKSGSRIKLPKLRTTHEVADSDFQLGTDLGQEFSIFLTALKSVKWFVTFNGNYYDDYILNILLSINLSTRSLSYSRATFQHELIEQIYTLSVDIIEKKIRPNVPAVRSIDLKHVARTEKSLKMIGGTLNYPIIMDFPVDPHMKLDYGEFLKVFNYLSYDLEITTLFYESLRPEIQLRHRISLKYGRNVMHEDRPGIADQLFMKLYSEASGMSEFDLYKQKYKIQKTAMVVIGDVISSKVKFGTRLMQEHLHVIEKMIVNCFADKITISIPEITINNTTYQMGAGGLHSKDTPGLFLTDKDFIYRDADVSSYYPRLIVTNKLFPSHLTKLFYELLEKLMIERLLAKDAGNEIDADTLKIVINSIFGKTGEKNNWYYSAEVFLGTTINGQLYLLMLIEELEAHGIEVISANTDGITAKIPIHKQHLYQMICDKWMKDTEMKLEFADYDLYARLSVGSYLAVTNKGKIKTKNEFNYENSLDKAANAIVIPKVLIEYLVGTYLKQKKLSVNHMVKMYLSDPKNSIYDFMWTQKPMSSDWHNIVITPINEIHISKTVRHLVCTPAYPHKVKLMKQHVSQKGKGNLPKRTSYVASEYSALTSDMLELNQLKINVSKYIKLDYYINEIESKIRLITTQKKSGNLNLFE